jgi:hypothetical protein
MPPGWVRPAVRAHPATEPQRRPFLPPKPSTPSSQSSTSSSEWPASTSASTCSRRPARSCSRSARAADPSPGCHSRLATFGDRPRAAGKLERPERAPRLLDRSVGSGAHDFSGRDRAPRRARPRGRLEAVVRTCSRADPSWLRDPVREISTERSVSPAMSLACRCDFALTPTRSLQRGAKFALSRAASCPR